MRENKSNSGQNNIVSNTESVTKKGDVITTDCTSIDKELDKLKAQLPLYQRDKLELIFLVLDAEGHEATAIQGIKNYRPHKVIMEWKYIRQSNKAKISDWAMGHNLAGEECKNDRCFNYHPSINEKPSHLKELFYGVLRCSTVCTVPVLEFQKIPIELRWLPKHLCFMGANKF
jgi:hypothetical protein